MKLIKLIIIGSFILLSFNINAQIVTERPTQSESSSVLPKGSFQIETGMVRQTSEIYFEGNAYITVDVLNAINLFRFGISKSIELRLLSQYTRAKDSYMYYENFFSKNSGFNDIEIGAKVQVYKKEDSKTEVAFETHLSIPTGSTRYTNDTFATINKIAVSHALTDKLGLGYNVGYIYNGNGESTMLYSLGLGYSVNNKFGFFVEPYGDLAEFNIHTASINGGIYYQLKDNFQVDFSFGTGINHHMNFLAMGFGWLISPDKD